jgi:hypothetical protein
VTKETFIILTAAILVALTVIAIIAAVFATRHEEGTASQMRVAWIRAIAYALSVQGASYAKQLSIIRTILMTCIVISAYSSASH